MYFNFDNNINEFLKIIIKTAQVHDINVYFVGGMVRDNLLNKPISDIDLIIDKNALDFIEYLPSEIKVKSVHKDFYTAKVEYNNQIIDIASTREEHYPNSGCLPVIDKTGVDIKKDYTRRDFTINSMYCKLTLQNNNICYELIDYTNGLNDIKNKTLRVLHNKSYIDDPTRILRGVNFKYRFGFDFSPKDKQLINNYLDKPDITNASYDRIISVFKHILSNEHKDKIFKDIIFNKYYKIINNSELDVNFDLIKKIDIKNKAEFYLKILINNKIEKFKFKDELDIIHTFSKMEEYDIAYYFYKTKDDNAVKYQKLKEIKLLINGNDLIELGFEQGKKIGEILNKLLLYKLKNPNKHTDKEFELNFAIKNKNI